MVCSRVCAQKEHAETASLDLLYYIKERRREYCHCHGLSTPTFGWWATAVCGCWETSAAACVLGVVLWVRLLSFHC